MAVMRSMFFQFCKRLPIHLDTFVKKYASLIIEAGVGNCEELSWVALHKLHELNPNIAGEVYRIKNGDHCVLVIGLHAGNDKYDWRTWGKAIICDVWLGEVFFAEDIPTKLVNTVGYGSEQYRVNYTISFNSEVHNLIPAIELHESNSKIVAKKYNNEQLIKKTIKTHHLFHARQRAEVELNQLIDDSRFSF